MNQTFAIALLFAVATATDTESHPTINAYYPQPGQPYAPYPLPGHPNGPDHHHHSGLTGGQRNPWSSTVSATFSDRMDWYSPYQQYSPALKQFEPMATHTIFAQCIFEGSNIQPTSTPRIQLSQIPGKAIIARWDLDYILTEANLSFAVRIMEVGDITDGMCANVGNINGVSGTETVLTDEFNPLSETDKNGVKNPFQDPSYGRLPDIVLDADGKYVTTVPISLLQNLEGRYSIMGRSIVLVNENGTEAISDDTIYDCCTIVHEAIPDTYSPTTAYLESLITEDTDFSSFANFGAQFGTFGGFGGAPGAAAYPHPYPYGAPAHADDDHDDDEGGCQINLNLNQSEKE